MKLLSESEKDPAKLELGTVDEVGENDAKVEEDQGQERQEHCHHVPVPEFGRSRNVALRLNRRMNSPEAPDGVIGWVLSQLCRLQVLGRQACR